MNLSRIFIERPIMTALIALAIVLFGTLAFRALPVAALPSVDYPTIQVNALLPGASPETMASGVATPLERQFSTIAGISSMSSINATGSTSITVQFTLDRNIDAAAQDVQAAISAAGGLLPSSMPRPPTYQKVNPAEQPVLMVTLDSPTLPLYSLDEYADTLLAQRISMVSGVSRVQVYGSKYAVRVQVDPDKLAAHNIGIDEVQRAIGASNTNLPTGRLDGDKQAFTIQSSGSLGSAAVYRPIIVAWRNGTPVRLEQLGNVIDSVAMDKLATWTNGTRCIMLAIQRQPGTNTVEVVENVMRLLPQFRREMPASVHLAVLYDASRSIRNSIRDVEFTLLLTVCVVVMVIFLFLRNLSATLIPGCAVPFSIVGTFGVMYLLGYSLNNLSLMALVLSVGFVVDDAIVMLENIVRHMELGETRAQAAQAASREIGFTILSMTFSLVAVFIPVLFMGGIVGRLLHEFSITIVVAILISGFVSLSLTPMLGSRFLKPSREAHHGLVYHVLESGFNLLTRWYEFTLGIAMRLRLATLAVAVVMLVGTVFLFKTMPTGFIPSQDSGFMFGFTMGPQDISFDAMAKYHYAVSEVIRKEPGVQYVGAVLAGGTGFLQSNQGVFFVMMKPRSERLLSVDQIIEDLRPKVAAIPAVFVFMQNPPPITVSGQFGTNQYQLTLQSANLDEIYTWAPQPHSEDAPAPRLCGRDQRHADLRPPAHGGYRPRPRAGAGRDRAAGAGRVVQRVRDAGSLGDLRASQSILGHHGGGAAVPAHTGRAREAVHPLVGGAAGAARCGSDDAAPDRSAVDQPFRPASGGDGLVQPEAGLLAGPGGAAGG